MLKFPIYLDNHSTTQVAPRVLEEMLPYFTERYGNASSKSHEFGWKADAAVEIAREKVSALINCDLSELVFTSGTTESVNLAIKGAAESNASKGRHIITTNVEHKVVLETCKELERKGFIVTYLNADKFGMVEPSVVSEAITDDTILVSVIFASNEIGSVNNVTDIGRVCREKNVLFHVDGAQAVGKIPVDVARMNIDLMSFSAHKMYGPKGVGALFVRKKRPWFKLNPQMGGGGQECGLRSGTLNVPGIVGFGRASELLRLEMAEKTPKIKALRDKLSEGIVSNLDDVYLNGHPDKRLPGNLNLSFKYVDSGGFMAAMKDVALSSGSACSSDTTEPSHVLKAIGLPDNLIRSSIRFGIGIFNTEEEIDYTIKKVVQTVNSLREVSPAYAVSRHKSAEKETK
jgi:cysteine desulfurase